MNPGPDLYISFFKMLAALMLVLGLLLLAARWIRSGRSGHSSADMPAYLMGTIPLGIKKAIALVKVADRVLVVGLSSETMVLLDKIDDQDQIRMLKFDGRHGAKSFGRQLAKILARQQDPRKTKPDCFGEES